MEQRTLGGFTPAEKSLNLRLEVWYFKDRLGRKTMKKKQRYHRCGPVRPEHPAPRTDRDAETDKPLEGWEYLTRWLDWLVTGEESLTGREDSMNKGSEGKKARVAQMSYRCLQAQG